MDSIFFALFIWAVIITMYAALFWALFLAVTMRAAGGRKLLIFLAIVVVQPFAALVFLGWYYTKHKTLMRIKTH